MSYFASSFQEARKMLEESLSIQRQLGDRRSIASTLNMISDLSYAETNFEEYFAVLQESLGIYRQIGDRAGVADSLQLFGCYYERIGKWQEAISMFNESAAIYEDIGRQASFGESILHRGMVEIEQGLFDQGRKHLQFAREILKETDNQVFFIQCDYWMANLELYEGHIHKALQNVQECIAGYRKLMIKGALIGPLAFLAQIECRLDQTASAQRLLCEALDMAVKTANLGDGYYCLPAAVLLTAGQHEPVRAVELYSLANYKRPGVNNTLREEEIKAITTGLSPEAVAAAEARGRALDLKTTLKELLLEFSGSELEN
jgi:tetratricopeptide (TPR) repeat protein